MPGKERILVIEGYRPNDPLDTVVIDLDAAVDQEEHQAIPVFGYIGQGLAEWRLSCHASTVMDKPTCRRRVALTTPAVQGTGRWQMADGLSFIIGDLMPKGDARGVLRSAEDRAGRRFPQSDHALSAVGSAVRTATCWTNKRLKCADVRLQSSLPTCPAEIARSSASHRNVFDVSLDRSCCDIRRWEL